MTFRTGEISVRLAVADHVPPETETLFDRLYELFIELPGVLSDELCFTEESHFSGLLEYPQYTRPGVWRGRAVPDVLLSGAHAAVDCWRRKKALEETLSRRPDMLSKAELSKTDIELLEEIKREG